MKYRRTKKVLVKYAHYPCLQGSQGIFFAKVSRIQYEELCSFLVVGTSTIIIVKATPRYPTMTHEAPLPPHDYRTLFTCTTTISQLLKGCCKITCSNTWFQFGKYTKSSVNVNSFYANFTNTHFQKVSIPHLTRTMKQKLLH